MTVERDASGAPVRLLLPYHSAQDRHCPEGECIAPRTRCDRCHVVRLSESLRLRNLEIWRAANLDISHWDAMGKIKGGGAWVRPLSWVGSGRAITMIFTSYVTAPASAGVHDVDPFDFKGECWRVVRPGDLEGEIVARWDADAGRPAPTEEQP